MKNGWLFLLHHHDEEANEANGSQSRLPLILQFLTVFTDDACAPGILDEKSSRYEQG
jgi:hypothetical protein